MMVFLWRVEHPSQPFSTYDADIETFPVSVDWDKVLAMNSEDANRMKYEGNNSMLINRVLERAQLVRRVLNGTAFVPVVDPVIIILVL
jgi:hypothetical protein